jgi:large subunit ribosomal protein L24
MATTRAKLKIKKGDTVLVIAGKDKGAKGKVIQVYRDDARVLVEGVNRIKKHTKVSQTQRGAKTGGIVTQEAPIHVSNVQVVGGDGKRTRIGSRTEEVVRDDGRTETKRVRIGRRTGEDI